MTGKKPKKKRQKTPEDDYRVTLGNILSDIDEISKMEQMSTDSMLEHVNKTIASLERLNKEITYLERKYNSGKKRKI